MLRVALLTLPLLLAAGVARAAPVPQPLSGPASGAPPKVVVVAHLDAQSQTLIYREAVAKSVPVTEYQTEQRGAVQVKVPVTVERQVLVELMIQLPLHDVKAMDAEGNTLPMAEVLNRLTPGTPILLVPVGTQPAAGYLRL